MIKTVTDNSLLNNFNKDYNYLSWFNKTSSCLKKTKVEEILKATLNKQNSKICIDRFREELQVISNYRISNIEDYREIILEYANTISNMWYRLWHDASHDTVQIAKDFINSVADRSLYTFFEVKYIGRKRVKRQEGNRFPNNLIFNFNFDTFLALTSRYEEMYAYETVYRHLFMLVYLLELIKNAEINISNLHLGRNVYDNLNSTVLTGMEAFAEFDLGYSYVMLFDELKQLTPESRRMFTYCVTPDNLSITCKIKDYSIITSKFAKYLGNAPTDKDVGKVIIICGKKYTLKDSDVIQTFASKELDTATDSELRIVEGSTPDRIKVIITLSGQRIINRLFSPNGNVMRNLKTHILDDYIYLADNFVAFTLWVILNSTKESKDNFKGVKPSEILPYIQYVQEESKRRQRNIVPATATAILLSKMSVREREMYLRNNFDKNATQQRTFIRRSVDRIKKLQGNIKKTLVARLVKELNYAYKW